MKWYRMYRLKFCTYVLLYLFIYLVILKSSHHLPELLESVVEWLLDVPSRQSKYHFYLLQVCGYFCFSLPELVPEMSNSGMNSAFSNALQGNLSVVIRIASPSWLQTSITKCLSVKTINILLPSCFHFSLYQLYLFDFHKLGSICWDPTDHEQWWM